MEGQCAGPDDRTGNVLLIKKGDNTAEERHSLEARGPAWAAAETSKPTDVLERFCSCEAFRCSQDGQIVLAETKRSLDPLLRTQTTNRGCCRSQLLGH